jgi:hypothetical protein
MEPGCFALGLAGWPLYFVRPLIWVFGGRLTAAG